MGWWLFSAFAVLAGACAAVWVGEAEAARRKLSDETADERNEEKVSPLFTILAILAAVCEVLLKGEDKAVSSNIPSASAVEKGGDEETGDFIVAEPRTKVWMNEVVEQAENLAAQKPKNKHSVEDTAVEEEQLIGDHAENKDASHLCPEQRSGNGNAELTFSFCSQSPSEPGYRQMRGSVPAESSSTVTTPDETWEGWRKPEGDRKDSMGSTKITMLHDEGGFSDDSKGGEDTRELDFGHRTPLPPIIGDDELHESPIYYELVNGKPNMKPRNTSLETFDDLGGEALAAKVKYSSEFADKLKRKAKKMFGLHQEGKLDRHSTRAMLR